MFGVRRGLPRSRRQWGAVAVEGDSMRPTLQRGDWLLVRWGASTTPGDVVVLEHPSRPGFLLVKRLLTVENALADVRGDDATHSEDSRAFGPVPCAALRGRVVARYRPRPRLVGPGLWRRVAGAARRGRGGLTLR